MKEIKNSIWPVSDLKVSGLSKRERRLTFMWTNGHSKCLLYNALLLLLLLGTVAEWVPYRAIVMLWLIWPWPWLCYSPMRMRTLWAYELKDNVTAEMWLFCFFSTVMLTVVCPVFIELSPVHVWAAAPHCMLSWKAAGVPTVSLSCPTQRMVHPSYLRTGPQNTDLWH